MPPFVGAFFLRAAARMFRLRLAAMWGSQSWPMPHTFPSTAQSAFIVGRTPPVLGSPLGTTPPSASRSVDDADFIGEKRVQGDPRGPGGTAPQFRQDSQFWQKVCGIGQSWLRGALWAAFSRRLPDAIARAWPERDRKSTRL